jgi:hypothetical protein
MTKSKNTYACIICWSNWWSRLFWETKGNNACEICPTLDDVTGNIICRVALLSCQRRFERVETTGAGNKPGASEANKSDQQKRGSLSRFSLITFYLSYLLAFLSRCLFAGFQGSSESWSSRKCWVRFRLECTRGCHQGESRLDFWSKKPNNGDAPSPLSNFSLPNHTKYGIGKSPKRQTAGHECQYARTDTHGRILIVSISIFMFFHLRTLIRLNKRPSFQKPCQSQPCTTCSGPCSSRGCAWPSAGPPWRAGSPRPKT